MLICDRHNFIFTHIPKVAGSSLQQALIEATGMQAAQHSHKSKTTKHETLPQFAERFCDNLYQDWY